MVMEHLLKIFQAIILSGIAATGFAMVFNVPKNHLKYCCLLGALGNGVRTSLMSIGLVIEWSSFAAAFVISCVALYISYRHKIYPKIISIAAAVPMFPGVHAYSAAIAMIKIGMLGYTEPLMSEMVTELFHAFFIVGALALGLTIPGVWLGRRILHKRK